MRKKKTDKPPMISLPTRLPPSLVEGIDIYVARIVKKNPGLTLTRAEGIRMLLRDGLIRTGIKVSDSKTTKGAA